jgi:hypothetical protein
MFGGNAANEENETAGGLLMFSSSRAARIAAGLAAASICAVALACKPGPPAQACPATFKDLSPADQNSLFTICSCPANAGTGNGSVWGSSVYTTDSNICKAAVHSGALSSSGGTVTVKKSAGCGSYSGTTANGVTSQSWGSFDTSFFFSGRGTGACGGAASASGAPAPGLSARSGPSAGGAPSAAPSASNRH